MTLAWMCTSLAVSALLLAVAYGADAVLAVLRRPRRWAWALTMLAMCVWPLVMPRVSRNALAIAATPDELRGRSSPALTLPMRGAPDAAARPAPPSVLPRAVAAAVPATRIVVTPDSMLQRGEWLALLGWALASLLCAALVFAASGRIARARRTWSPASRAVLDEVSAITGRRTTVWSSAHIGPAAFGVWTPQIVVPAWADTLPSADRSLLLRHEASHLTAHDPLLLRLGLAAVVLLPWNLPLLFAYRRLHRAVEHDCDARVLAATRDARGYGRLLLDMAERLSQVPHAQTWSRAARWLPAPIPGIGTQRSELEARLRAMVVVPTTWRSRGRAMAAGALAVACFATACAVPSPERSAPDSQRASTSSGASTSLLRRQSGATRAGTAGGGASTIDSIMMFERLMATMERLGARGTALIDTAVVAAARTAFPDVFANGQPADAFVWMLLDSSYRAVRTARGKEFYSMRLRTADDKERYVPVGATRGPVYLSVGTAEIMRAFPGVRREQIGMWSEEQVTIGSRTVRIVWARYLGDAAEQPVGEHRSDFPELSRPRPWDRRDTDSSFERFTPWIQLFASQYAQGLLEQSPTESPVLWVLLNNKGEKLAHGSGRQGLFGVSEGPLPSATTGFAPATAMTADKDLGIDCAAFNRKFPDATRGTRAHSCGMLRQAVGDRYVVVVYGIANSPGEATR
jgi:beta-lactamase regulating signal transducer with metallopeptidase domain